MNKAADSASVAKRFNIGCPKCSYKFIVKLPQIDSAQDCEKRFQIACPSCKHKFIVKLPVGGPKPPEPTKIPAANEPLDDYIGTPPQDAKENEDGEIDEREAEFRAAVIEKILNKDFEMPLLPHVALKVIRLTGDANTSMQDLAKVILTDQAIASQILKIANSPVYAGVVKVTNISQGLMRLGIAEVKNLMLAISLKTKVFRSGMFGKIAKELWTHSVGSAFAARTIAFSIHADKEEAFLCGLMHDLGKMILLSILEETQKKMKLKDFRPSEGLMNTILKQYHSDVGELACVNWNLPETVQSAIKFHHNLDNIETKEPMPVIVVLSSRFARHVVLSEQDREQSTFLHPTAMRMLQLTEEDCQDIFEKFETVFENAKGYFIE